MVNAEKRVFQVPPEITDEKIAKKTKDFAAYRAPFINSSAIVVEDIDNISDEVKTIKKASEKYKKLSDASKAIVDDALSGYNYPKTVVYVNVVAEIVDMVAKEDAAYKKHIVITVVIIVVVIILVTVAVILFVLWKKGKIFKKK